MTIATRLWPGGFVGRVTLVLVAALVVQFAAGSLLIGAGEYHIERRDLGKRIAEQLVVAERILETAPTRNQAALLSSLSTRHLSLRLVEGDPGLAAVSTPATADIATSIVAWEPGLADHDLRLSAVPADPLGLRSSYAGALQIGPDRWIAFSSVEQLSRWGRLLGTSLRVGIVALLVLGTAAIIVRTLSDPLRRLSSNARLIGTDTRVRFAEDHGPHELRQVSHALNSMQDQIEELIDQRTQALAAVGHDLRTPLARLRLRIDRIGDSRERRAALADIDQMGGMLQELHDFFETGEISEPRRPIDLSSLALTIAEAFADGGAKVRFEAGERVIAPAMHDHLRRAIENLVDNAMKYGGAATLSAERVGDTVEIAVCDRGPGIAPQELDRVTQPFERLDRARASGAAGLGLGLSIAQNVALAHGGKLMLSNRPGGGLRAAIVLPIA